MRAFVTLWVALALWLVPATVERRVPGGGVRTLDATEHVTLEAIRLPERVVATARGAGLAPVRVADGPPFGAPAALDGRTAPAARLATPARRAASRRVARPRRLAFPTEAIAPPPARS